MSSRLGASARRLSPERHSNKASRKQSSSPSDSRPSRVAGGKWENIRVTRGIKTEADLTGRAENLPTFRGPDLDPVSRKEFKKIQESILYENPVSGEKFRINFRLQNTLQLTFLR
jgi:hypothetical protein